MNSIAALPNGKLSSLIAGGISAVFIPLLFFLGSDPEIHFFGRPTLLLIPVLGSFAIFREGRWRWCWCWDPIGLSGPGFLQTPFLHGLLVFMLWLGWWSLLLLGIFSNFFRMNIGVQSN
jgi:hypothetical protein